MKSKIILAVIAVLVLGGAYIYLGSGEKENLINNPGGQSSKVRPMNEKEILVYETEAESEDECSSYEYFDEENSVCYFECSDEAECKAIEADIEKEFENWTGEEFQNEKFDETPVSEESKENGNVYSVSAGEKISSKSGNINTKDKEIWTHVSNISPDWFSDKYVDTFETVVDAESGTLAWVEDPDGDGKWKVGINVYGYDSSTLRERNLTIIHELGHILVLNRDQLNPEIDSSSCKYYHTDEGCTGVSSYLNLFTNKFWTKAEVKKIIEEASEFGSSLYKKDKFVTEYAATTPEEDIAESFAYFVIDKKNEGQNVKDLKTVFFYSFPELVNMRDTMRQGVSSDIVRARKMAGN